MNKSLTQIYKKENLEILAIRIQEKNGEEPIRLYIKVNEKIKSTLDFSMSQLVNKVTKLRDFGKNIGPVELFEICKAIESKYEDCKVISYTEGIGWQYDKKGKIDSYKGTRLIDCKGNEIISDIEKGHLETKGNLEVYLGELQKYLNSPLRQSVYIGAVASIVASLLDKNIVINISGKSRIGKTTLAKLCLSAFSKVDDSMLYKPFNGTENSILQSMEGINGACALIDDSSLKEKGKNLTNFIYNLESGKEKGRLKKGSKNAEAKIWRTTTILTSEESILFNCDRDKEGVMGRLIEISPTAKELFDSAEQANNIQELYKENYGLLASIFVEFLLKNDYLNKIHKLYKEELKKIRVGIKDNQLNGIAESIAVITLTGELLNEAFNMNFNIEEVQSFLLQLSTENLEDYRAEQVGTKIIEEVYPKLIKLGQEEFEEHIREDGIWIESKAFKKFIKESVEFTPREVRNALKDKGILVSNKGNSYNITYKSQSLTGVCIRLPEEGGRLNG